MKFLLFLHEILIFFTWNFYFFYMKFLLFLHEIFTFFNMKFLFFLHEIFTFFTWNFYFFYMKFLFFYMKFLLFLHEIFIFLHEIFTFLHQISTILDPVKNGVIIRKKRILAVINQLLWTQFCGKFFTPIIIDQAIPDSYLFCTIFFHFLH